MKRSDFQFIVDVVVKEHDCYFEIVKNGDNSVCGDELILREFLLEAQKKGFNIKHGLYDWDKKIEVLNKEANK